MSGATTPPAACNVCDHAMVAVMQAHILVRHAVTYFQCPHCGFLRTEKPHWLDEAYSSVIAATDTGLVARNLDIAGKLGRLLPRLFPDGGRFLDTAAGTGLLVRLMRDDGFEFFWQDLYCTNALAAGFEDCQPHYVAVTAFEAIEHMERPFDALQELLARSTTQTFIFTTELYQPPLPPPQWWYFAYASGQHISFFTPRTMQTIAQRLGLTFLSHRGLHMFTALDISEAAFRQALDKPPPAARPSLMQPDHIAMTRIALRGKGASDTEIERLVGADIVLGTPVPPAGFWARTTHRWQRSLAKRLGQPVPPA